MTDACGWMSDNTEVTTYSTFYWTTSTWVDDNPQIRSFIRPALEHNGFK